MSDLQIALIAAGAGILCVVVFYNAWQGRKLARDTASHMEALAGKKYAGCLDLMQDEEGAPASDSVDEVADPVITLGAEDGTPFVADSKEPEVLSIPEADAAPAPVSVAPAPVEAVENLDTLVFPWPADVEEQIDLVAVIDVPESASCLTVPAMEADMGNVRIHGLSEPAGWRTLNAHDECSDCHSVLCALQLADRSGAVTQGVLDQFRHVVDTWADDMGGAVVWKGSNDPRVYAEELDQFCVEVDLMVSLHVMGGAGPFAGTKLRGLAETNGLVLLDDGNFHALGEGGNTVFMVVHRDQKPFTQDMLRSSFVRGISFQLDVPHSPQCVEAFDAMTAMAQRMCSALGGQMVDDAQNALGDTDIGKIRQKLQQIRTRMLTRGIQPGSQIAGRLFS